MSKKIESLTEEQESKFDLYVRKWVDIGLSTTITNEEELLKIERQVVD
jgi:hypothetical protein